MNIFAWGILQRKNPIVTVLNESSTLYCNCHEVSPSCDFILGCRLHVILLFDSVYMKCLNAYAKTASVGGWLLDFWFVALADLLRLDQKASP
jgi:hypothetical protein